MIMSTFGGIKGNIDDPNKSENALMEKQTIVSTKKTRCFTLLECPIATKTKIPHQFPPKTTPPGNKYNFAFLKRRK